MVGKLTLLKLLYPGGEDYFWKRSAVNNVFRPSVIFNEIIYGYLKHIEDIHADEQVYFCETSLIENMYFENGDHKCIRFKKGPIKANGEEDFRSKRALDYINMADLIGMVHGYFFMPPINDVNSPELVEFLGDLRNSSGKELWIKEHYILWDPSRRFNFFIDLEARCKQPGFEEAFQAALEGWRNVDFATQFEGGFQWVIRDDAYLFKRVKQVMYPNTYSGLVYFVRNVAINYSGNVPYTKGEIEWRIFKQFPFILKGVCNVLMEMRLYSLLAGSS